MAKGVKFPEQNDKLLGHPDTNVYDLPIYRQGLSFENGVRFDPCVVSCW